MNKYISIIIPTLNSEEFLHESLNSILQQKIDLDIYLADGSSKDKTLEIVNNYKKYLNIEVVSNSDYGQSNALNKALDFVKTPFFLTLQSDDIILPNMIKDFIDIIKFKNGEDYLYISADTFFFNKGKIQKYNFGCFQRRFFVKNGIWVGPFPSMIWNTKVVKNIGGFREDLHFCMDFELVQRYNKKFLNPKINYHLNKIYGGFRKHPNAKTTSIKLKSKVKNEHISVEKEYKIKIYKRNFLLILFKFLYLTKYLRYISLNEKRIINYLKVIKNRNLKFVLNQK